MSQITLGNNHTGKVRLKKSRTALSDKLQGLRFASKKREPEHSFNDLQSAVLSAASHAETMCAADPHLRELIAEFSERDPGDRNREARELDGYIAALICRYVSNPHRHIRMRSPKCRVMTTADLKTGKGRCVAEIACWGYRTRFTLDFALPK